MDSGTKKPWLSKTVWFGVLTAIAPFISGGQEYIAAHPDLFAVAWGVLAVLLRLVTKDSVSLKD